MVQYAREVKTLGLDTETYGHDVAASSPAFRAKIHVWSLSFFTKQVSPRGFRQARGAVLPKSALDYAPLRSLLTSPDIRIVAHNTRHDQHALANIGINIALADVVDTLELARLVWPERAMDFRLGFTLKALATDLLGKPKRELYRDVTSGQEVTVSHKPVGCACGDAACRKRKLPEHAKLLGKVEKLRPVQYQLEGILPGHPNWERLLAYAADDAVDALEIYSLAHRRIPWTEKHRGPSPW